MNQERANQYCAAFGDGAHNAWPLTPSCNFFRRKTTSLVRAWNDTERPVFCVAFVQVQPHSQHSGHHRCRGLHMRDTSLDRPWAKLCQILSLTYCNGAILVPDDLPIGIGSLVEQDATHSEAFLAEYRNN